MLIKGVNSRFFSVIEKVSKILVSNAEKLKMQELYLFGSLATSTYNFYSDVDLLIVTAGSSAEISGIVEDLEVRRDVGLPKVDIIVRTKQELSNNDLLFNTLVSNNRILLWRNSNEV